jgi:hypothetical protein
VLAALTDPYCVVALGSSSRERSIQELDFDGPQLEQVVGQFFLHSFLLIHKTWVVPDRARPTNDESDQIEIEGDGAGRTNLLGTVISLLLGRRAEHFTARNRP